MNQRRLILLVVAGLVALVAVFLFTNGSPPSTAAASGGTGNWLRDLEQHRRSKDEDFRTGSESPIPSIEQRTFQGLKYYAPDSQYRVTGTYLPAAGEPPLALANTSPEAEAAEYAGQVAFVLLGQPDTLAVFRYSTAPQVLFIPFRDGTTGTETYAAGRYLDAPLYDNGTVLLDFNYAYNPYCAYSPNYTCPLPPQRNRLQVQVRAGERDYAEHGLAQAY
jgi:hypothetical protein